MLLFADGASLSSFERACKQVLFYPLGETQKIKYTERIMIKLKRLLIAVRSISYSCIVVSA